MMDDRTPIDERILLWESLISTKSVEQLKEWVLVALMPITCASSAVLAAGISKPSLRVQPLIHTEFFPGSLVGSFQGRGATYVVPLLNESLDQGRCVVHSLDGKNVLTTDSLWRPCLAAQGFKQLIVCSSTTPKGQFAYLCLTDPRKDRLEALTQWLPILCLHIRDLLSHDSYWHNLMRKDRAAGQLNRSEIEILRWVSLGKTNHEIASILGLSSTTVKNKIQGIIAKLNVSNRTHAVSKYFAEEWGAAVDDLISPRLPVSAQVLR